jgi:hypothetical protein
MTEISPEDFASMFGGGPPRMTPEQEAHVEAVHKATHDAQMLAYAQVQFFGAILCDCNPRFTWGEPSPPQLGCVVHGHMQADHEGRILLFGIPRAW